MAGRKNSGAEDPLALWRHKDPLFLGEAASLLAGEPPGRSYVDTEPEDRRARDAVFAFWTALVGALESGELVATVMTKQSGGESLRRANDFSLYKWLPHSGPRLPEYAPVYTEVDKEKSTVFQADLRAWCERRKLAPAFFASPPIASPAASELGDRERKNLLALVGVLAELAGMDMAAVEKGHAYANLLAPEMLKRKCSLERKTIAANMFKARICITPFGTGWTKKLPLKSS